MAMKPHSFPTFWTAWKGGHLCRWKGIVFFNVKNDGQRETVRETNSFLTLQRRYPVSIASMFLVYLHTFCWVLWNNISIYIYRSIIPYVHAMGKWLWRKLRYHNLASLPWTKSQQGVVPSLPSCIMKISGCPPPMPPAPWRVALVFCYCRDS